MIIDNTCIISTNTHFIRYITSIITNKTRIIINNTSIITENTSVITNNTSILINKAEKVSFFSSFGLEHEHVELIRPRKSAPSAQSVLNTSTNTNKKLKKLIFEA